MVEKFERDTLSDQILQGVDTPSGRYYMFKDTPSANPVSYTSNAPFGSVDLYAVATPDQTDPKAEPVVVLELERMGLLMTKRGVPQGYTQRRVDADELFFIHRGSATIYSEVGEIDASEGRFVFMARGVGYRVVPRSTDFMAMIFYSMDGIHFKDSEGKVTRSPAKMPFAPPRADGQTEWEERVISQDWRVTAIRDYDPVWTNKLRGQVSGAAFSMGTEEVSANNGPPLVLCRSSTFHVEVAKRWDPLPFYHRNCNNTEVQFVHAGGGNRDTELGFRFGPVGSLNVFPVGIEHSVSSRPNPCLNVIWEVKGRVQIGPNVPVT